MSNSSIKVSDQGLSFLKKLRTNRRKADVDPEDASYWKLIEIMAKYFKLNNEDYLELVKMEIGKNA